MSKGVNLVFLDNSTVDTDYIKNLTKVAEEQDTITRTALKSTIKLLLIVELDKMTAELEKDIKEYLGNRNIKQVDLMQKHNISRNTFEKNFSIIEYIVIIRFYI